MHVFGMWEETGVPSPPFGLLESTILFVGYYLLSSASLFFSVLPQQELKKKKKCSRNCYKYNSALALLRVKENKQKNNKRKKETNLEQRIPLLPLQIHNLVCQWKVLMRINLREKKHNNHNNNTMTVSLPPTVVDAITLYFWMAKEKKKKRKKTTSQVTYPPGHPSYLRTIASKGNFLKRFS